MKVEQIKIGKKVRYWDIIKDNGEKYDSLDTVITSDPWELGGGHIVCNVEGKRGGVSIKHLEEI